MYLETIMPFSKNGPISIKQSAMLKYGVSEDSWASGLCSQIAVDFSVHLRSSRRDVRQFAQSAGISMYSIIQYSISGEPYWVLDEDLCRALRDTDVPEHLVKQVPQLPYDGLYIEIPPGMFTLFNEDSGEHEGIGVYVSKDKLRQVRDGPIIDGILLMAAGESKSVNPMGGLDDAVEYGWHTATTEPLATRYPRLKAVYNIVLNLLFALSENRIEKKNFDPFKGKGEKKAKRLRRKGYQKYSVLSLSGGSAKRGKPGSGVGAPKAGHVRRGHWHAYWVLNPRDQRVHDTQLREGKAPLYKVYKWVFPSHVNGGGKVKPKKVEA
jgi:hypothetical protein